MVRSNWAAALGLAAGMLGSGLAEAAPLPPFTDSYEVEIGGTDYFPDQPPTSPLWSVAVDTAGATQSLPGGGILRIDTASLTDSIRYDVSSGWTPGAAGSTIEARLQVVSQLGGAASAGNLVIGSGAQVWVVRFSVGGVSEAITGGSFGATTDDALHTYRFTTDGTATGTLDVYRDGAALGSFAATGAPNSSLRFGEDHDGSAGRIDWDYVRWTNTGVFVPEPSAMALVALTGTMVLRRRRTDGR